MKWIPMTEQLPPNFTPVLGWNKTKNTKNNAEECRIFTYAMENTCDISHWMALPGKPEDNSETGKN